MVENDWLSGILFKREQTLQSENKTAYLDLKILGGFGSMQSQLVNQILSEKLENYLKNLIFGRTYLEFDGCRINVKKKHIKIFAENKGTATDSFNPLEQTVFSKL